MTAAFLPAIPLASLPPTAAPSRVCRPRVCAEAAEAPPPHSVAVPFPADPHHRPHLPDVASYTRLYNASLEDPSTFWRQIADTFHWHSESESESESSCVLSSSFRDTESSPVSTQFLPHRLTNICYNAVDRHALLHPNKPAFICEPNDSSTTSSYTLTYAHLSDRINRVASFLKHVCNVRKGDVVLLYLPMIPELPISMLACARLGALHCVVFAGFSADALAARIRDSKPKVVIVAQHVVRGRKTIPLRAIADNALSQLLSSSSSCSVQHQLIIPSPSPSSSSTAVNPNLPISQHFFQDVLQSSSPTCPIEWVPSEHPLFVLYTSGSTGKPKGVVHSTGGYMVYVSTTFKYVFDYHSDKPDVFFSTSDCGWITGHSYVVYGPLLNAATQILHDGIPNYPSPDRLWHIIATHKVTQLYTAPTVIRALQAATPPEGSSNPDDWVRKHDLSSLRVLGTVGEPISPAAWWWFFDVVGQRRCAVVDTWWQTETGGHCMTPLPIPGLQLKPGAVMMPFFGIDPVLIDESDGSEVVVGEGSGLLAIRRPWPSALRSVWKDHQRMQDTYFNLKGFADYYITGDGARRDEDGVLWVTGRVDDLLNVSGHRIGTAEVESALARHGKVAEAAVVGVSHEIKGESIYAYVCIVGGGNEHDETLRKEIRQCVREHIGPFAAPDVVHWAPIGLPKTRSGKIMRRILRVIARDGKETDVAQLGDVSTLTDPAVVPSLIDSYGA